MSTTTQRITISGVIVYDTDLKECRFIDYLTATDFADGVWESSGSSRYILLCEHTIAAEAQGVDLKKIQLDALDAKRANLVVAYQAALTKLDAERQSLLAIECAGA